MSRCTAEATRLRVQSLDVRFAASDLTLDLASGDKVIASPRPATLLASGQGLVLSVASR